MKGFKEEEKASRRGPRCALSIRSHGVLGEEGEEGRDGGGHSIPWGLLFSTPPHPPSSFPGFSEPQMR